MDDDQFAELIIRTNKDKEVIIPSFSQIILLFCVFVGTMIVIYMFNL